jgi:two-component system chemotaxis response regulator CheY
VKLHGHVLVVDDESHIRKFVTVYLQSLGEITVAEAVNGTEALQLYASRRPQLVLLDVNMPRVDGLQTLRQLKEVDPGCVVVMLTSLVNRQTVEACLRLGALGYLRKDNPPDEMFAQLRRFVASSLAPAPAPTS